ncbi:hypothetical protein L5G32_09275 [Gordonia sp. HY002]|nr:hypothetical protein [Gordonia zhenghanii]
MKHVASTFARPPHPESIAVPRHWVDGQVVRVLGKGELDEWISFSDPDNFALEYSATQVG